MTNKRNKKQLMKLNKGITLVALVITIIVLLILVGVTIATLTGDNGILTKAKSAKTQTEQAKADENLKIAIAGSYGTDGKLNLKDLKDNLKNQEISYTDSEEFPLKVTVNGEEIQIRQDGTIEEVFNTEEWDKTATPEDCFVWKSNTKGEEGYSIIIGFTAKLQSYSKVRIPSRCEKITGGEQPEDDEVGRAFFEQVEKVEIPNTVKEIGKYAFCTGMHGLQYSLKEINIPDSVTNIGMRAFGGCINLKKLIIPESVKEINWSAFEYWNNTQTINFRTKSEMSGWENEWDRNCNANIVYGYTEE